VKLIVLLVGFLLKSHQTLNISQPLFQLMNMNIGLITSRGLLKYNPNLNISQPLFQLRNLDI
jgi:hypothetical protein